ncbi:MAG: HEPN domain-containing protein [Nitrospira sp.]|nr:HEPN domain-containing protein [Nitrospira sp.]
MTPDQAALLRKAQASLRAAQLLAGERLFDFAVSRAYYTMFYVAEALLLGQGLSFSKHSAVLAAFGEHLAKPAVVPSQFHKYLLDGEDSRHVGDYDLGPGLSAVDAAEQISRAQEFLDLAARLLGPLPPSDSP